MKYENLMSTVGDAVVISIALIVFNSTGFVVGWMIGRVITEILKLDRDE